MAEAKSKKATKEDIEKNKAMAIVAWFVFFVPLLTDSKDSPFVKFHVNQALNLIIAAFGLYVIAMILTVISFGILFFSYFFVWLAVIAFWIIGLIGAANGDMKPLPIIGKFELIK